MSGGEAVYYIAVAAMAAGAIVEADNASLEAQERARILKAELKAENLRAIEQENERLIDLRLANEEILAMSGGVDPYASPSLVAARKFNFKQFDEDQKASQLNLSAARATTSAQIRILNRNARVAIQTGILSAIGTVGMGMAKGSALFKPDSTLKVGGGANATKGYGHLDLPQNSGVLV